MRFLTLFTTLTLALPILSAATTPRYATDTTPLDKRALFEIKGLSELTGTFRSLQSLLDKDTLSELHSVIHHSSILLDEKSTAEAKALLAGAGILLGPETGALLKNAGVLLSEKNVKSLSNLFPLLDAVTGNPSLLIGILGLIQNAQKLLDGKTVLQVKETVEALHTALPLIAKVLAKLA